MKIALGGGAYMESDEAPRNTRWHKRIVRAEKIANTRVGHNLVLECGHRVQAFGHLQNAAGVVLCTQCRDVEGAS